MVYPNPCIEENTAAPVLVWHADSEEVHRMVAAARRRLFWQNEASLLTMSRFNFNSGRYPFHKQVEELERCFAYVRLKFFGRKIFYWVRDLGGQQRH